MTQESMHSVIAKVHLIMVFGSFKDLILFWFRLYANACHNIPLRFSCKASSIKEKGFYSKFAVYPQ